MLLPGSRRARRSLLGLALSAALVLTGCSGDGEDEPAEPEGDPAPTSVAADEPYLPVPEGVELTAPGSELALGDTATVAYEPRQGDVAALEMTVDRIEKATFKLFSGWKLDADIRATTPYFVRAELTNVGDTDLGGRPVELYAVDGANKLIEASTFASTFKPCPSEPLPQKFATGDSVTTCLVYLAPDKGELTGASFRPTDDFDPIVWTGEITKVTARDGKDDSKGKKKKSRKKKQG